VVEENGGPAVVGEDDEDRDESFQEIVEIGIWILSILQIDLVLRIELNFIGEDFHAKEGIRKDEQEEQH